VDYVTSRLEFSPVLGHMLGMSDAQIPTTVEGWKRVFHPDDWQGLEHQNEQVLRGELPELNIECRVFHTNGAVHWILVRGNAHFDSNGNPCKTIGTSIEITDRKNAELERDLFFDLSLDLLCIADTNGYFRRVNPAFCKTLGYDADELTSRPFFAFVHPEDMQATEEALAALTHGKNVVAFENRYQCKDGSWRWLSWACPAVLPGSQTIYAIARDVTETKRVALALQDALLEAEKANRAKNEFLSRMSHELRTPLNAILGFGQLLQRDQLSARQRKQIDMMVNGGRHLLTLINEVLDITKIEAGRLDLSPEAVDLIELIQEVVGLTQPMADQRRVRIFIDQASISDHCVLADKQRLKQVLLNLISNAIKYNSENGHVRLFGQSTRDASAGDRFLLHVQDTGPGIPMEKQSRLFTPFDRLGAETTLIEGCGLGLVLSKGLVEVMGGSLSVASTLGEGTTCIIELTHRPCPVRRTPATASPTQADASSTARLLPKRTLLYIEDNLANVQLVESILSYRPGVRLVPAMQGGLGLELARQHHPDLILLDVHLPDMRGQDLLAILRTDPRLRHIPVIAISADATKHQMERLLEAGAKSYLIKPIDVENFLRILDRYLHLK
jgi:PAS domain S-box-containing protein